MFTTENAEKTLGENNNQIYLASLFPALDPYSTGQLVNAIQNISLTHPRNIRLILNDNAIGDEGCEELAKLWNIPNLLVEHLEIADNKIEDKGAIALTQLKNLRELVIADNQITIVGVKELIKKLPQLTSLNIGGNVINETDVLEILKINGSSLTSLGLDIEVSDKTSEEIGQWLKENEKRLGSKKEDQVEAKGEKEDKKEMERNEGVKRQVNSDEKVEKERKSENKKEEEKRSEKESEEEEVNQFSEFFGDSTNKQEVREIQLAAREIRLTAPKAFSTLYSILKEHRNKVDSSLPQQCFFQAQTLIKQKDVSSGRCVATEESKGTELTKKQ